MDTIDTILTGHRLQALMRRAITVLCPTVVALVALGLLAADAASAALPEWREAAYPLLAQETLNVVLRDLTVPETFTDGVLGSCVPYTARKYRCGWKITEYQFTPRPERRRYVSYVERGWVKIRCRARCKGFRLSVTHRTELALDRDAAGL